jgi:hypothetical protein
VAATIRQCIYNSKRGNICYIVINQAFNPTRQQLGGNRPATFMAGWLRPVCAFLSGHSSLAPFPHPAAAAPVPAPVALQNPFELTIISWAKDNICGLTII